MLGKDVGVASSEVVKRDGAALLLGPRGRYACAQVAGFVDDRVEVPFEPADEEGTRVLLGQLRSVDVASIAAFTDLIALLNPLGASVDAARYWQEPDDRDVLLQDPRIVTALEPIAHALAAAPAARWWWSPVDLNEQAIVRWLSQRRTRADRPQLTGTAERLEQLRSHTLTEEDVAARERPVAFDASYTGAWWSTPTHANITTTSRRLDPLPAVQLELVEDAMGWERARVAPVDVDQDRRVLEIRAPSDWTDLVDRFPLSVDRSRRHDWWRATGGTGPWQIPDWAAVGQHFDGVHLTVAGYLASAGCALATRAGQTVLAGFDPDLTYWLTDSLTQAAPTATWQRVEPDDAGHEWVLDPTIR